MATRTKKQKAPDRGLLTQGDGNGINTRVEYSTADSPRQPFPLSVDSLTRIAFIAGDPGVFLLGRLPHKKLPDPNYLPIFEKALFCLEVEDALLRRAGAMEAGK